jgi:hypothetical protein
MEIARKECWKTIDMPDEKEHIELKRTFSIEEYASLCMGNIPKEMEDKWFIYLAENKLYFHRSWTGFCIYVVSLERVDKGYVISDVYVNRNKSQYKSDNKNEDVRILINLIERRLLNNSVAISLNTISEQFGSKYSFN